MARKLTTAAELRAFANELREIAGDLDRCAAKVDDTPGMKGVFIHSHTILNNNFPELHNWSASIEKDVKSQSRATLAGVKSQAEKDMARAETAMKSQEAVTKKSDRKGRKETKGQ